MRVDSIVTMRNLCCGKQFVKAASFGSEMSLVDNTSSFADSGFRAPKSTEDASEGGFGSLTLADLFVVAAIARGYQFVSSPT